MASNNVKTDKSKKAEQQQATLPRGSIRIDCVDHKVASDPRWYGFRWNGQGTPPTYFSFPFANAVTEEAGEPTAIVPAPDNGSSLDVVHAAALDGAKLDGIAWLAPGARRLELFRVKDDGLIWTRETNANREDKVRLYDSLGYYAPDERALLVNGGLLPKPAADDLNDDDSDSIPLVKAWPELPKEALYGLAGEVVKIATENSEADPAAVLITFLTWFGATVGNQEGETPSFSIGDTEHAPRLFAVIVGQSSRARKGTSASPIKKIMKAAGEKTYIAPCQFSPGPLSSGEGVIDKLRDDSEKVDDKTGEPIEKGAKDKRLMVLEGELSSVFKVCQREGNTLSTILRVAWDGGVLEPLTKSAKIKSTNPHLAIVGHITHDELKALLNGVDLRNGFANRFLWVCARRSKLIVFPKPIPKDEIDKIADKVAAAIDAATPRSLAWSASTIGIWQELYPVLSQDRPGAWGYATARAEAQVIRLAMLYALLDEVGTVTPDHLTAACAVWQYCDQSVFYIFGVAETDTVANKILEALSKGELSQTQIKQQVLQGHVSAAELATTLQRLQDSGRITQRKQARNDGPGRPTTFWSVISVLGVKSPDDGVPDLMSRIRIIRIETKICAHCTSFHTDIGGLGNCSMHDKTVYNQDVACNDFETSKS